MKLLQVITEGVKRAMNPFEEEPAGRNHEDLLRNTKEAVRGAKDALYARLKPYFDKGLLYDKYGFAFKTLPQEQKDVLIPYGPTFLYDETIPPVALKLAQRYMQMSQRHTKSAENHTLWTEEQERKKQASLSKRRETRYSKQDAGYENGNTIPEGDVPAEVDVWKDRLKNPYFMSAYKQYAGDPDVFPFSPKMNKTYQVLKAALARNNIPAFHTMYSSETVYTSDDRPANDFISFIIIGGDAGGSGGQNSVVWERLGHGRFYRNNLWVSGNKIRPGDFELKSEADQDKFLAGYQP